MNKILVPCDFSELTVNAFRFAIDIAKKSDGEILLLHVIESPIASKTKHLSSQEEASLHQAQDNALRKFEELIDTWAKGEHFVTKQLRNGAVVTAIIDCVRDEKADLIVIGTKAYALGIKEIMVGSTTEKVVRLSVVPVIALKNYAKDPIKNIVLANSLIEENEEFVEKVKALQDLFGATLHIVHINTTAQFLSDREIQQRLSAFAKRHALKDFTITNHNALDPESGLVNFIKEIKGDMVAMGTHGHNGLAHIFNVSVAEAVKHHVNCPIWTVKI